MVETLRIPVLGVQDHEADDAIATLAVQAWEQGIESVIVTADRDFFQLVRPGITVMFNVKGISDIRRYDVEAVTERFGLPPEKYLDYVALKGDASDNIPGVPGVGEKTASKLVQDFGSTEELLRRTDELKGRLKASIEAAGSQLVLNKELAQLNLDVELPVRPEDCVMGEWDVEAVRRLFTSLEFRTLFERLEEVGRGAKPAVEVAELDLREATAEEVAALLGNETPKAVRIDADEGGIAGVAVSVGGGQAAYAPVKKAAQVAAGLESPTPKWTHDAKDTETAALAAGARLGGIAFDTMLAGYLLDPAAPSFALGALCEAYLGVDVLGPTSEETEGQLFGESWRTPAAEAAAVALLTPVIAERVDKAGLRRLLDEVELPLSSVLAGMQAAGVALDVAYLEEMAEGVRDRMAALREDIYRHAGEEFNLNSPPQLRTILYEKLRLSPGKRTSKGQLSTDASVLEKLRDAHPIVDALLSWRELDKLNSTYLEALPRQVDPRDGRVHTTFNQTGAATGRLSSSNPNLQNIPVRGELGRQIRRAFVPGSKDQVLLVADYSQIELRILAHLARRRGPEGGVRVGDRHPHGDLGPGVRAAGGPGRPRDAQPREGDQLRARLRDGGVGARLAPGDLARRGPGVHRRLLRELPADPRLPRPPGGARRGRGLHRDDPRAPPLHPRAPGLEPARARHGTPDGAQRPDPGERGRRVQARHAPRRRGAPRRPGSTAGCCSPSTTSWCSRSTAATSRRRPRS